MKRVPVFFEAWNSQNYAELQMCRKTMRALLKLGVSPLPYASSVDELRAVLQALVARGMEPGVFVVNTYWAEEQLLEIDPLMSEHVPALFFRRALSAEARSKDLDPTNLGMTSMRLSQMKPRLSCVWEYGKMTSDALADKAAHALTRFLSDGNFRIVEIQGPQPIALNR